MPNIIASALEAASSENSFKAGEFLAGQDVQRSVSRPNNSSGLERSSASGVGRVRLHPRSTP
jgi:hypothetical protein